VNEDILFLSEDAFWSGYVGAHTEDGVAVTGHRKGKLLLMCTLCIA